MLRKLVITESTKYIQYDDDADRLESSEDRLMSVVNLNYLTLKTCTG